MLEIYEKVRMHLLTQNARSTGQGSLGCRYRGVRGMKCAVGCLMSDEEYTPDYENCTINNDTLRPFRKKFTKKELCMLEELQNIHDRMEMRDWKKHLDELAIRLELPY